MGVPANVICAWPSTAGSIPSGWSRETSLDAVFIQGAGAGADADLSTPRGSASHTHTSPAHTPIQNPHTVSYTASTDAGQKVLSGAGSSATLHSHGSSNSPSMTATNQSSTVSFNANTSNDPPYKAVIWIKSDGTPTGFPVGAYAFFESDGLPAAWSRVVGNTYLKGAAAAGDGGGTGGAATHMHTSAAHTHLQNSHNHTDFDSSAAGGTSGTPPADGISVATFQHTHHLTPSAVTATNQSTTNDTDTQSLDPVFRKLNIISNGGVGASLPAAIIAVWGGTNATIPTGWTRYTAQDGYFLKGANADGESTSTGGSLNHTHTAICQPLQNVHTHGVSASLPTVANTGTDIITGTTVRQSSPTHAHIWSDNGTTATNQALSYPVDVCANEAAYPLYRRVIFIQLAAAPPTVHLGGYTSYDINRFDVGSPEAKVLPEVEARIRAGDQRFMPERFR